MKFYYEIFHFNQNSLNEKYEAKIYKF